MSLVDSIDIDEQRRQLLNVPRILQPAPVNRPDRLDSLRQFHHLPLSFRVVRAHDYVRVYRNIWAASDLPRSNYETPPTTFELGTIICAC